MKLKNIFATAVLAVSVLSFTSCNDNDEPAVAKAVIASTNVIQFDGMGASESIITVYSDAEWHLECPDWITVTPDKGSGTTEVTIEVADNLRDGALDNPRKAELVFCGNTLASRAVVLIRQAGDNYRDCPTLKVNEINAAEDEIFFDLANALVVAKTANGAILTDETYSGYVLVSTSETMGVGDKLSLRAQKLSDTRKLAYILPDQITLLSTGNAISLPDATDISQDLVNYKSSTREYVSVTGMLNGNNISVTDVAFQATIVELPEGTAVPSLGGHIVTVKGFFAGVAAPFVQLSYESIEDHGEAITIFFSEDFEWLAPWAAIGNGSPCGDTVGENNADANAPQLGTPKVDVEGAEVSAYDALLEKGYIFTAVHGPSKAERKAAAQTYLQTNYLKFGLTGYQTDFTLPEIKIPDGTTGVILDFDWCSQRQGSGAWDATQIEVVINNGETEATFPVPAHTYEKDEAYAWLHCTIELNDFLKNGSIITIRNIESQRATDKAYRYFIDNIRIYKQL